MKYDIKNIIILILLFVVGFLGYTWLNSGESKEKIKQIEKEIKDIQIKRDSIQMENNKLKIQYNQLLQEDKNLQTILAQIEEENKRLNKEVEKSKKALFDFKSKFDYTRNKIDDIKKNPINRQDDELVNSLKNKINKL
jgi:septal ring factor EnvC (AmiA/AmiB activator)